MATNVSLFQQLEGRKIIQTAFSNLTTIGSDATAFNNVWVSTGITCSISPLSASSTLIFIITAGISSSNPGGFVYRLKRGSTVIQINPASTGNPGVCADYAQATATGIGGSILLMDEPGTTSSTTYTLEATVVGSASGTLYINRDSTDTNAATFSRYASSFAILEVL